jgi:5'-nucleotidase
MTGHTHAAYNCVIDGRPVTSASSFGRLFRDIDAGEVSACAKPSRGSARRVISS